MDTVTPAYVMEARRQLRDSQLMHKQSKAQSPPEEPEPKGLKKLFGRSMRRRR